MEIIKKHSINENKIKKILICGIGSIGRKYIKIIKHNWPSIKEVQHTNVVNIGLDIKLDIGLEG